MNKVKKSIAKVVIGGALLFGVCVAPLASCSTMFGEDGFVITDVTWKQNESDGSINVTIATTREDNPNIVVNIPSGNGVKDVTATLNKENTELTVVVSYTDPKMAPTAFKIPIIKGKDGKGIAQVEIGKDTKGNVTIKFIYTDSTSSDLITIPSGKDGSSIKDIEVDEFADPDNYILNISFTDGSTPISIKLRKPKDGISVLNITYNEEKSTDESYCLTIIYSDDFKEDVYFPRPKSTIWHHGENNPNENLGKDGDYYLNVVSGFVYYKNNGKWTFIFSMDGSGSYIEKIVTFNPGDGTWVRPQLIDGAKYTINVKYGGYIALKDFPIIEKEGYNFAGWYTGDETYVNAGQFTDLTPVQRNMDLYPRWTIK